MPDPIIVQRMNAYRAALLRQEAAQMRDMAARWQTVERNLAHGITDVLAEIARREAAGEDFGRTFGPYVRLERYQSLLHQVRGELGKYGAYTEAQVQQGIAQHVAMGVEHSTTAIEVLAGGERSVLAQFNRLSIPAIENMAAALQADAPVGQLLAGAWPDATVRMTEALINGVALGWNPRKTARAMREGLRGALQRSLVIARTEQLRDYRTASLENYRQSGVVTAYKRLAAKSLRTCIACLIADGRVYALEESFDEHPNGRCTLVPILVGRPEPIWETGRTWFERQPAALQRQSLGPAAYEAWRAGAIRLEDLVERHEHPVWGGSLGVKSLKNVLGTEKAKRWYSGSKATLPKSASLLSAKRVTAQEQVELAEKQIFKIRDHEESYVIDPSGVLVMKKTGGATSVEFTDDELKQCKGKILTHNHPVTFEGTSFSDADVRLAATYELAEVRAVGGIYAHSLKVQGLDWKKDIEPEFNKADAAVRGEFLKRIDAKTLMPKMANLEHNHEVWTRVGSAFKPEQWQYKRYEHAYHD